MRGRNMEAKIIKILRQTQPYLREHFGIKKLAIFGSVAKGTAGPDSDVDIVVEFSRPIGFKFMELSDYLETILSRKVDILTMEGIKAIRIKKVADEIKRELRYV